MIDNFFGDYRFLSNFYPCGIKYYDCIFPSVENAYQASKCWNGEDKFQFISLTAGQAKRQGDLITMHPNFHLMKYDIMLDLCRQKFNQEPLRHMLLNTGDEEIVEGNTWGDIYWGICDGRGENNLGKILMQIRKELRC